MSPYILAVCSHKGGTGRTTAALALAWSWGLAGLSVVLADADPIRSASMVALDADGECPWRNVRVMTGMPVAAVRQSVDIVVVDCPSLMDPTLPEVLAQSNGVILCCLSDPLSLRTVPSAAAAINGARLQNPRLELLGILIGIHHNQDALQTAMLAQLRDRHGELLLEPPIPSQPEVRDWPLSPGSDLPGGPTADAYATVARTLENWIRSSVQV